MFKNVNDDNKFHKLTDIKIFDKTPRLEQMIEKYLLELFNCGASSKNMYE